MYYNFVRIHKTLRISRAKRIDCRQGRHWPDLAVQFSANAANSFLRFLKQTVSMWMRGLAPTLAVAGKK
jgi:hypothetical protein